jgi:prefoldin subunit 5
MPWWTWSALGFFVAVVTVGAVFALISLLRMRRARATGDVLAAALDDLTRKTEELEARLERAAERAELVERKIAQLQGSMERLSVLTWALGDVGKTISQVRSAVIPHK